MEIQKQRLLLENVSNKEKQERLAIDTLTSETLSKLNIKIENLPQKCQHTLQQLSNQTTDIDSIDPIALLLRRSKQLNRELAEDYEILKLKQKDRELDVRIERNKKIIESLRRDLEESKKSLACGDPNPDTVQDSIRLLKQKVLSYHMGCEKAKTKFMKLSVPEGLYPKSLEVLVSQLATLKAEEMQLKEKADDVLFSRQMREKLTRLRI